MVRVAAVIGSLACRPVIASLAFLALSLVAELHCAARPCPGHTLSAPMSLLVQPKPILTTPRTSTT